LVVGPSPTGGATIFKKGLISERSVSTRVLVPVLVQNVDKALAEFWEYCVVAERLTERVSGDYRQIAKRLLKFANGMVSEKTIRDYLATYLGRAPKTYNNQLDGLRAFIGRYLKRSDLIKGYKKAYQPQDYQPELPTKEQLRKGFYALTSELERSLYLMYATAGLRRSEALGLRKNPDVDFKLRCIRSKHDTRTKKAGVTFYNEECEEHLQKYLSSRNDSNERVFVIGSRRFRDIWDKASEASGFRITPQVLRVWHSTELGELGVPDRYVDVFQGRAPKSVLGKYYTGKDLLRLKRIYDKAELKVLS
jgi:integrase